MACCGDIWAGADETKADNNNEPTSRGWISGFIFRVLLRTERRCSVIVLV